MTNNIMKYSARDIIIFLQMSSLVTGAVGHRITQTWPTFRQIFCPRTGTGELGLECHGAGCDIRQCLLVLEPKSE